MASRINLLGAPSIESDGAVAAAPRGAKSWAVLAYLVRAERPVPRARLVGLLFDEAEDPAGALRWTLSQVRRAVGQGADLSGDPVRWSLAPGTQVDVDVVLNGRWSEALALPGFGGELLEGLSLRVGPAFELWLSSERRRMAGATATILHEGAHRRLADSDAPGAVELATRLVACDPLEERGHELLVRTLVAAGRPSEAAKRVRQCEELFRREIGHAPSAALHDALRSSVDVVVPQSRSSVLAAIDVGVGAAQAGAYDRSVEVLRRALVAGEGLPGDLAARALTALGTVLVHGVRGSDEEAVSLLHRAYTTATQSSAPKIAAQAAHELGVVETLRAHYSRAEMWFARATELAGGDPGLLAWVNVYAGFGRTDQADYARALAALEVAEQLALEAGDRRALAYAATGTGRLRLLRGELGRARAALKSACATTRELGWTSFLPLPQTLLAEVDLLEGDLEAAEDGFEHSYAVACQVGDPCWESYALRGRGLLAAARGEDAAALDLLTEAPGASRRPDAHAWVEGYCLDALCDFAVRREVPEASRWAEELQAFASRHGMRELVVRAVMHRVRLAEPGAREGVPVLLAAIDNPALQPLVAS